VLFHHCENLELIDGLILSVCSPIVCHKKGVESLYHYSLLCLQNVGLFVSR
jgi:hypothetical protein